MAGIRKFIIDEHSEEPILTTPKNIFFLPQTPYLLPYGSLQDQITYPLQLQTTDTLHSRIHELLELVQLFKFLPLLRANETEFNDEDVKSIDWIHSYSPGEIQKLVFVRALFHRPSWLVLDEGTYISDFE